MPSILENPLVLLILACEVGFWVVLAAGLIARYVLRRQRLSTVLLLSVPLVDLLLVTVSIADVASGSPPEAVHGLAAVYLGFTVAFGHSIVSWADARAAHWFGDGPAPVKPPKDGLAGLAHELGLLALVALATVIALGVVGTLSVVAGDRLLPPAQWPGDPLWGWALRIVILLGAWIVFGPVWVLLGLGGDTKDDAKDAGAGRGEVPDPVDLAEPAAADHAGSAVDRAVGSTIPADSVGGYRSDGA
ncbi:hypothetical protein [Oerskovia jenensis]|uniref:hypothetical protein n=1 Tax=Oerskovia jenensis TaxID=162169 RepID=UPI0036D838F4